MNFYLFMLLWILVFAVSALTLKIVLGGESNDSLGVGLNLNNNRFMGINVNLNKLNNNLIKGEIYNIAKNFNRLQPILCDEFKSNLREMVKSFYTNIEKGASMTNCGDATVQINNLIKELNTNNMNIVKNEEVYTINNNIIASLKKILNEITKVSCDSNSAFKPNDFLRLMERSVNTICNIGYNNIDY